MATRLSIACLLCLTIMAVGHADGGNGYSVAAKHTGKLEFSGRHYLNMLPIIEKVHVYSSAKNEVNLDLQSADLICNKCLEISSEAEKVLNDPDFTEKVEMIFSHTCQILPPDLESKCTEALKMYLEDIFSYLRKIFDKENLCYSTGLCAENATTLNVPEFSLFGSFLEASSTKGCTACHNATNAILTVLEDAETKIKIIKFLLKVCEQVDVYAQQCKKLVFEYGPILLSKVENYLEGNDLCAVAEFCRDTGDFGKPEED